MKYTKIIPALLSPFFLSACGLTIGPPSGSYGSTPSPRSVHAHHPNVHEERYDRERGLSSNQYYGYQDDKNRQEEDFQALMNRLRSLHFDSERKEELRRASRVLTLSGEQVKSILDLYHFDSEKFEILGILSPAVRSYRDALIIEQYFRFDSDQKRARQILNQYELSERYGRDQANPRSRGYGYPNEQRRQDDFQALMNRLRSLHFDSERKEELRRASRVLTLSGEQIKSILDLYRFDSEKFEVLGILAPTVRTYRDVLIVEQSFRFSSERERVRQILSRHQTEDGRISGKPSYGRNGYPIDQRRQEEDFQALMNKLRSIPFKDDRKEELRRASRVLTLSGGQVCKILDLYRFNDERFEILGILAPTVRYYKDALTIEQYFRYPDDRNKVREILQNFRY